MILRKCRISFACLCVAVLIGCTSAEDPPADPEAAIRAEVEAMADDFVNLRMLTGFVHEMPLAEAYRWQDEMIEILGPAMGEVVGYKTGGHDPNPPNASFPPGGIRAHLLSGMFRADPSIRVEETSAGFLEADFAFRVGDVSINTAETDLEILAGLDAVVPFAEIPDPYYDPDGHRESDDRVQHDLPLGVLRGTGPDRADGRVALPSPFLRIRGAGRKRHGHPDRQHGGVV